MTIDRRRFNAMLMTGAAGAALAPAARAETPWPSKPIRFVVPYTPGGFTDVMARLVATRLTERLGQQVLVENKPGANSIIGVDAVAKAPPDGHTFAVVIAAYAANTTLYPKLPYDPRRDLQPVSLIGVSPLVAAVNLGTPFKDAKSLVAYAKANPGKVSFGSSGNGSAAHLTTELLKAVTGTYMVHIPYRGAAPALTDLTGGHIQLFLDAASGLIGPGKGGKVRLIGTTGEKRLPALPDLPTFAEQGIANFSGSTWAGVLAPAGTPKDIVQRMATEITRIVRSDELRGRFEELGTFPGGGTPEEFERFVNAETEKWGRVIKRAGITADR